MKHRILFAFCAVSAFLLTSVPMQAAETAATKEQVELAAEIHRSGMLFDGHNDLPWQIRTLAGGSLDRLDITVDQPKLHTDVPKMKKSGLKAQFWSVYVPVGTMITGDALLRTTEQIELANEMFRRYPEVFAVAKNSNDIEEIVKTGRIASMLGVEGGYSIENSLPVLERFYNQGVRYMTLTHTKTTDWADSSADQPRHGGLSPFGEEVVAEMNRLGMLVDLSHVSVDTMYDAIRISKAPVIFSHSSARAICDHTRNVPDGVLKLMPANGGVVMVNFMSGFVVPTGELKKDKRARGTLGVVADHIDHIVKVAGIDHVGLGADYDGVTRLPVGLEDVSKYPDLTLELVRRGYTKEQIHKILGGNILRALKQAEKVSAELKKAG
ncbi:Membrane dipeptidase (Peptidase family M19) [Caulifigura coniformis]|uniref:Membrane dipeptidase (Peptidase family M19) n=1 Tax=Caulifigura coniformis TaxID=2527983 RepID=A0A517SB68_9PLAN|nr:dipeptidase [Caulifigura coniformis]QDT53354.1 Membrane dipeptidase (Peptidase family M19) [Caulifigura coniformis]